MAPPAKFAKDERAAEKWVATVLDVLEVRYPKPEMRLPDFRQIFQVNRKSPPDHMERWQRPSATLCRECEDIRPVGSNNSARPMPRC
jgi:hypothetical protein